MMGYIQMYKKEVHVYTLKTTIGFVIYIAGPCKLYSILLQILSGLCYGPYDKEVL